MRIFVLKTTSRVRPWMVVALGTCAAVLVVVAASATSCVNLSYPPGASLDGGDGFVAHLQTGAACLKNGDCRSGFCSDGYCCVEKCDGTCVTCGKAGSEGRCVLAQAGSDPHDSCPDEGVASCGKNGACDGTGSCQTYPIGTICAVARCQVQQIVLVSRCTAAGACMPGTQQPCYPFLCDDTGTKCRTSCVDNSVCANGVTCANGVCGQKALGTACSDGTECVSGFCAQGVCCTEACSGLCHSCGLKGSEGACTLVPAGVPPTPAAACATTDAETCGMDGTCDGVGGCRLYVAGTLCSATTCSSALLRPAATCDGKNSCKLPAASTCGGYTCDTGTTCKTACATDSECASPSVCDQAACGGLLAQYFRQSNLSDLAFSRTDATINFNWGTGSPSPLLEAGNFSVRWRGKLTARFTEAYTFYAATDDGERLSIAGNLVIDHFVLKSALPEDVTTPIMLTAGKPVDIVLEYFEGGGPPASAALSWSSASEPKAIIPTSALAPQ
jgi:hypothetical protein